METVFIVVIIAAAVIAVFKIFSLPMRLLFKLLINTVLGFIFLIVLNYLGSFVGVTIGINWLNAAIVGVFGVSGVGMLLLLQWLMLT